MKKTRIILLLPVCILILNSLIHGQQVETKKDTNSGGQKRPMGIASILKDTANREELPPPPPPPEVLPPGIEMMKEVRFDTASWRLQEQGTALLARPDTSAAPHDELTIEIRKMIEVTGMTGEFVEGVRFNLENLRTSEPGLWPEEFYEGFMNEVSSDAYKRIFENIMVNIYRKYFNLEDVKGLIVLYQSDLGRKTLKILPQIMQETMSAGGEIGKLVAEQVYEQMLIKRKID